MIDIEKCDNGKYFIMVRVLDGFNTDTLKERLHEEGIKSFKNDEEELIISLEELEHKMSLNHFRGIISKYCDSVVNHFVADLDIKGGRYSTMTV